MLEASTGNGIGPWLGGFQPAGSPEPAGFAWSDGDPFGYTNWAAGEPNNFGGVEDRFHFFGVRALTGNRWNDYPARPTGTQPRPVAYVVVTPAVAQSVPEPATLALAGAGGLGLLGYARRYAGRRTA